MEKNKDIFTIGDNTNCGIIKTFEKSGDMIRVYFEDKPINYHVNLKVLEHCKQPLFVTEDGVEIFTNDVFYHVCPYWSIDSGRATENPFKKLEGHKEFSTKEKAQEYIDLHKPKYSLNEIIYIADNYYSINKTILIDKLKQLNK